MVKQRWKIVFLWNHRLGPKLSLPAVTKEVKCSISTASHWLKPFRETGDVLDKPGRGRKRKTSEPDGKKIIQASTSSLVASSIDLSHTLEAQRVKISATTIQRRLYEAGFVFGSALSRPLLTEQHGNCRLSFARRNSRRNWSRVIFTNETAFHLFTVPRKVWHKKGVSYIAITVKRHLKIQVGVAFWLVALGQPYRLAFTIARPQSN